MEYAYAATNSQLRRCSEGGKVVNIPNTFGEAHNLSRYWGCVPYRLLKRLAQLALRLAWVVPG